MVPVVGVLREQPVDDPADLDRRVGAELLQVGRRGNGVQAHDLARLRRLERRPAGEALEHDGAERVEVRAAIDRAPHHAGLLGSTVEHGPDHGVVRLARTRRSREPEVDQDGLAVVPQDDVAGGDVAVDESHAVRRVERGCNVTCYRDDTFLAEGSIGVDHLGERLPADELHDEVGHAAVIADGVDLPEAGVPDGSEDRRFAAEGDACRVIGACQLLDLDRVLLTGSQGAVNSCRRSPPELLDELEFRDSDPRRVRRHLPPSAAG